MRDVERAVPVWVRFLIAAAVCALATGIVCSVPANALVPINTLIRNTASIIAGNVVPDANDVATYDTWVGSWLDTGTEIASIMTGNPGDTVWIPITVSNHAGLADTVAVVMNSSSWSDTTIWDSGQVSQVSGTDTVGANDTRTWWIAIAIPADSAGAADSLTFSMYSVDGGDSYAFTVSLYVVSSVTRLAVSAPAQVYAGLAFGITVTAQDSGGAAVVAFDSDVTIANDTGTVAPVILPQGSWAAGVWAGNLVLTDCFDTVQLVFQNGALAETVAIRVINYRVAFDRAAYEGLPVPALLTVWDPAADTPPGTTVNTVTVQVSSTADAAGITVTLTESGPGTGIFTGSVAFTAGASTGGKVRVDSNGNVFVSYDPDGAGAAPAATAQASWVALTIGNLEAVRTWPNPFRLAEVSEILITPLPPDPGLVVEIYNAAAQRIRTLNAGDGNEIRISPQEAVARWDGRNDRGDLVASGTYIYLVRSSYGVRTGKLTFIK